MTLCRTHNLHDGIIYVFNQALRDFLTPLKVRRTSLVPKPRDPEECITMLISHLGNDLFVGAHNFEW